MSYPPLGTSVEQPAEQLVAEVETILCATGADKVHLVGHSLGGVVIAQAITDRRLDGRVDTAIILGSPCGGSPWAAVVLCRHRADAAGAAGRLAGVAPGRLRTIARRRAVAVGDRRTRHHRAGGCIRYHRTPRWKPSPSMVSAISECPLADR
jgi:pimeloyl-ACP methyl ester carboxylesterase